MTPALIMLVVPGLPSYNGVEVYYLKGVLGLPIVISFRDRWYTHFFFFFFFFRKWAHWWRHRHRLDRFRFQNFQSPATVPILKFHITWNKHILYPTCSKECKFCLRKICNKAQCTAREENNMSILLSWKKHWLLGRYQLTEKALTRLCGCAS